MALKKKYLFINVKRITEVLKVETDITTSITTNSIGQDAILVVMYVETFKLTLLFSSVTSYDNVFDVTMTDNFQYQCQFIDTHKITR